MPYRAATFIRLTDVGVDIRRPKSQTALIIGRPDATSVQWLNAQGSSGVAAQMWGGAQLEAVVAAMQMGEGAALLAIEADVLGPHLLGIRLTIEWAGDQAPQIFEFTHCGTFSIRWANAQRENR